MKEIMPFMKRKEFLSIIGPRQSGKTTLLDIIKERLIKEIGIKENFIHIITFEDRKILREFEADPVEFIGSFISSKENELSYIMIDEFQYADEGGQKLKLIYDTVKNVKIIITGSSSLEIKALVGKYMVGRILSFNIYPFNFGEYLKVTDERLEKIYRGNRKNALGWIDGSNNWAAKSKKDMFHEEMIKQFEKYCIWGGYPAVVLSGTDTERQKVLRDNYNNYVLKDIKGLLELATEKNLFLLSQYLATQISNITVYQNLAQVSGVNFRQVKKYLGILAETYICDELRPFFVNRQKELSKNPKIFFTDMGFRNNLVENFNGLATRMDSGAIVENSVFISLREIFKGLNKLNFWRTKSGAEVDFVIQSKGEIIPLEVKYSDFKEAKITKSLASFIDCFKPKKSIVATKNFFGSMKKNNTEVVFLPVYYI
ncbi:MAG: hypothetical protein A3J83_03360 [Elusimicrobia bacterium RIFOXYA2_FULL_40_6]|nr:MAG: hypothetical protein A3J83_03360 [Elusimicrobia bacterium RIFOXYA2_FULL_40_6]